eukprot:c7134_g1_i1.p1 GENE.c7134_g1_i1~~c7134_g1_i1.p1  ORF type:complete len:310 (+),score=40.01 c7134_g1_i1:42-971(+)
MEPCERGLAERATSNSTNVNFQGSERPHHSLATATAAWLVQHHVPSTRGFSRDFKAIHGDFLASMICENLIPHLNPKLQKFVLNVAPHDASLAPRISRLFKRPDGTTVQVLVYPKPLPVTTQPDWPTIIPDTSESEDEEESQSEETGAPVSHSQSWETILSRVSNTDATLLSTLQATNRMFVVCDPQLPDCPIVHTSASFCDFTKYEESELIGRNCRFLQGEETTAGSVDRIRHCLKTLEPIAVCVLNYKKDGSKFWNHFFMCAMLNEFSNQPNYFVGVQTVLNEVTDEQLLTPAEYLERYRLVSRQEI